MKNRHFIFCLSAALIFILTDLQAQCPKVRVRRSNGYTTMPVFTRRKIYNLDNNNLPRKEQLNRDLKREPLGTKKYVLMVQERERIALEEIHKAQKYMLEHPDKKNTRKYREHKYNLELELDFISPTIEYMKNFPFADNIADLGPTLVAIRKGQIKFEDCEGKSYSRILSEIQDSQKKRLINFQKNYLRQKF